MDYSENVPIQYEEGKTTFMGMEVMVDPRVLIPRPETELLVTVVKDLCQKNNIKEPYILDIGTGSGVIPIGLIKVIKNSKVVGIDISSDALDVAKENVKRYDKDGRITLKVSDLFLQYPLIDK